MFLWTRRTWCWSRQENKAKGLMLKIINNNDVVYRNHNSNPLWCHRDLVLTWAEFHTSHDSLRDDAAGVAQLIIGTCLSQSESSRLVRVSVRVSALSSPGETGTGAWLWVTQNTFNSPSANQELNESGAWFSPSFISHSVIHFKPESYEQSMHSFIAPSRIINRATLRRRCK